MNEAPRFCTNCAAPLTGGQFCTSCGHPVGAPGAEAGPQPSFHYGCPTCGGDGADLPEALVYCPGCRWLRPLGPDYFVDVDAFMWSLDAQGMAALNATGPLAAAAHGIAQRFGRPVFEAAANGVRLSERQMPEIFDLAIRAARLMSLTHLPEIYISGEQMWSVYSLGGHEGSFVAIGSVLINFRKEDLLFMLAREMGHVRAGHVFWKTAAQFLGGQKQRQATILGEGVLQFLNPLKLVESAIEAPLMSWSRHSEITADRAALLATGDLDGARRVLTQWAMKSFPVYGKLNREAWLEQEAAADDPNLKLSEWTMASTPYLSPRLKVLADFAAEEGFAEWRGYIRHWSDHAGFGERPAAPARPKSDTERITCAACGEPMRVAKEALASGKPVNVRCPNPRCRKVLKIKPKAPARAPEPRLPPGKVRLVCVACEEPLVVDRAALEGDGAVKVRCPNPACGEVLSVKRRRPPPDQLSE